MHIVRTIVWVLLASAAVIFLIINTAETVPVRIWPIPFNNPLLVEWPVAFIATTFFLLGFLPTWLYLRGAKWKLKRRIHSLELAARNAAMVPTPAPEAAVTQTPETQSPQA